MQLSIKPNKLTLKHLLYGCTMLLLAVSISGCRSVAKTAGRTAVRTTVQGAETTAKAAAGVAKTAGRTAGHVAVGTANLVFGDDDDDDKDDAKLKSK